MTHLSKTLTKYFLSTLALFAILMAAACASSESGVVTAPATKTIAGEAVSSSAIEPPGSVPAETGSDEAGLSQPAPPGGGSTGVGVRVLRLIVAVCLHEREDDRRQLVDWVRFEAQPPAKFLYASELPPAHATILDYVAVPPHPPSRREAIAVEMAHVDVAPAAVMGTPSRLTGS